MKQKTTKKLISLLLAVMLVFSAVQMVTFADGTDVAQVGDTKYEDLYTALEAGKAAGKTVELLQDVVLTGEWTPVQNFAGTFDGKGYTITGLSITAGTGDLGLFGSTDGAIIKNVVIDGAVIDGATSINGSNIAVVAGDAGVSTFDNVTVSNATVTTYGKYVGAIAGTSSSQIKNCTVSGSTVIGKDQVGGIAGYQWCNGIWDCTVSNNTVEAKEERAGGIAGKMQMATGNDSNFKLNDNTVSGGTVTAPDYAGGLVGQIHGNTNKYTVKGNTIEDVTLTAIATNPIGNLRPFSEGSINTEFTGALATNMVGNYWSTSVLNAASFTYTAEETQTTAQTILCGVANITKGDVVTGYKTLADAVAAAVNGDTIKVIVDITLENPVVISKGADVAITLDLNGHTISKTDNLTDACCVFDINSDFTVTDNTADKKGKVIYTKTVDTTIWVGENVFNVNDGDFVIEAGNFEFTTTGAFCGASYVVNISNNWCRYCGHASATINGGTFKSTNGDAVIRMHNQNNRNDKITLTVNDGTFTGGAGDAVVWLDVQGTNGGTNPSVVEMYLNGGTYTAADGQQVLDFGSSTGSDASGIKVEINGGKYYSNAEQFMRVRSISDANLDKIVVNGGIFNKTGVKRTTSANDKNLADFVASGYKIADNTDADTLAAYPYKVVSEYEAQIDDTKYATLVDAVAAAVNGDTIKVIADITLENPVVISKGADVAITLDLNGHTISKTDGITDACCVFDINSDFTVTDNTEDKKGKVIYTKTVDTTIWVGENVFNVNDGDFVIEAGNFEFTTTGAFCGASYVVNISNNWCRYCGHASATINGGTFKSTNGDAVIRMHNQNNRNDKITLTVNGGTFIGGAGDAVVWLDVQGTNGGTNPSVVEMYLNGGTYTAADGQQVLDFGSSTGSDASGIKVEINGGKYYSNAEQFMRVRSISDANLDKIVVNGGIFNKIGVKRTTSANDKNLADFVASGYKIADNTDENTNATYPYTVAVDTSVAQIDDTKYSSLADAVAAVPNDNTKTTIKMLADVTIEGNTGITVAANKNIVLDLNGHTVKNLVNTNTHSQTILNYGTLTIKDSTDTNADGTGTGLLTNAVDEGTEPGNWWSTPQYNYVSNVITNCGKLTIESGKLVNTAQGNINYCVDNQSTSYESVFTLEGGWLYNDYSCAIRLFCNSTTKDNVVTINDGKISGYYAIWMQNPNASANKGIVTINGGKIYTTDSSYVNGGDVADAETCIYNTGKESSGYDASNLRFVITGGEFFENLSVYNSKAQISITGGIFHGTVYADTTKFISGGTFNNATVEVEEGWAYYNYYYVSTYASLFASGGLLEQYENAANYANQDESVWKTTGIKLVRQDYQGQEAYYYYYWQDADTYTLLDSSYIADGYTETSSDAVTADGYIDIVQKSVDPVEPVVNDDTVEVTEKVDQEEATVTNGIDNASDVAQEVVQQIKDNTTIEEKKATNVQKVVTSDEANTTSQIKIELKSINITTETDAQVVSTVTTNSIKYDVKPIIVTIDAEGNKTEDLIDDEKLQGMLKASGKSEITFRLAIPSSFTGDCAEVEHYPDGADTPDWTKTYAIQGSGDNRYVEVSASHFSFFNVKTTSTSIPTGVENATYSASLTILNNIDVVFKIANLGTDNFGTDFDDSKLSITVNGEAWTGYKYENGVLTGTLKSLSPEQMSSDIDVVVFYNDGENDIQLKTIDCSVRSYCEKVFAKKASSQTTDYDNLAELCKALLNYGKWAEDYANEKANTANYTPSTLNEDYEIDFSDYTITNAATRCFDGDSKASDVSANLDLGSTVTLTFTLTGCSVKLTNSDKTTQNFFVLNGTGEDAKQINPNRVHISSNGTTQTVSIEMYAYQLANTYTLKLKDVSLSDFEITYGVYTYCDEAQDGDASDGFTDTLKTLCNALHKYSEAVQNCLPN